MKFEELKQSKTYKAYMALAATYGAVCLFLLAILFSLIMMKDGFGIFIGTVGVLGLGGLVTHYGIILYKIKKTAKSFQLCEAKVVNVENGIGRGFLKIIVTFEDMMGEAHRMTSHGIFSQGVIQDYLEKTITVYYSPLWKEVLIKESIEDLIPAEPEEEDPFRL